MKLVRGVTVLLALAFMVLLTMDLWPQLRELELEPSWPHLGISLLLLVAVFLLDAGGWLLLLRAMGHKTRVLPHVRIWMLSSIARYIPGGIWSYASRAEMTRVHGIDMGSVAVALYLETVMLALSSLVAGLPALAVATGRIMAWWQVAIVLAAGALLLHPAIPGLLRRLPGAAGRWFATLRLPSFRQLSLIYLYYLLFWILFGCAFVHFANLLQPQPVESWPHIGSALAASFLAGFVMLFVPGGIGVREATLYILLFPLTGAPFALAISLASRLWIMTGEALTVALVEMAYRLNESGNTDSG